MTKFEHLKSELEAGSKVVVGLWTFKGAADVAKFSAKFENDAEFLGYLQTRIFQAGVKYVTHARFGC